MIVAGGYGGDDSLEYIIINDSFRSNKWRVCADTLPSKIHNHQLNIVQNKLFLTGGYITGKGKTNEVWQGTISFKPLLRVNWTPLPPMLECRYGHVATVINDTIFCIGGMGPEMGKNYTEYYSIETNRWEKGPYLPFTLSQAKGVANHASKQCIIIGGIRNDKCSSKVSLFDPIKGIMDVQGEFNIACHSHIGVLL